MADPVGYIDFIRDRHIEGWALDREDPEQPVRIELAIDSAVLGTVLADLERDDLAKARIGTGRHGFSFAIPSVFPVSRRSIVRARFAATGAALERSGETAGQLVADKSVKWEDDRSPWDVLARHDAMWRFEAEQGAPVTERFFLREGADTVRDRLATLTRLYGPLPARELALDFGCGSGRLTLPLARRFEQVLAFDVSGRMLAYAASHCVQQGLHNVIFCRTLEALAGHIENGLDLVLALGVFQHMEEREGLVVLGQLLAALKDGGRGCVELLVSNGGAPVQREMDLGTDGTVAVGSHAYSLNAVMRMMQEAGVRDMHAEFTQAGERLGSMLHFRKGAR